MARILLVDRDAAFATALVSVLSAAGHVVEWTDTAMGAMLDLAVRTPFDMVITDLFAPELDGFDLIVAIKESRPATPVLALFQPQAVTRFDQALIARALGASSTFAKPVEPASIAALVETLFQPAAVERRLSRSGQ
jgi:two-component system, chemotaxis family, chemotaxis protein CheY